MFEIFGAQRSEKIKMRVQYVTRVKKKSCQCQVDLKSRALVRAEVISNAIVTDLAPTNQISKRGARAGVKSNNASIALS